MKENKVPSYWVTGSVWGDLLGYVIISIITYAICSWLGILGGGSEDFIQGKGWMK